MKHVPVKHASTNKSRKLLTAEQADKEIKNRSVKEKKKHLKIKSQE